MMQEMIKLLYEEHGVKCVFSWIPVYHHYTTFRDVRNRDI